MLSAAIIPMRRGRCRQGRAAGNVRLQRIVAFTLSVALLAAAKAQLILQPQTLSSDASTTTVDSAVGSVPQRVDYRDRNGVFDLDLLGVATGMCSLSGECNACEFRDVNPCQVRDVYGADTDICQLPAGFLGGSVPADTLCGSGATVDLAPGAAGGSQTAAAATLTAFRTRAGALMLTVTTRCGWLLVPSDAASSDTPLATSPPSGSPQQVLLQGSVSYGGQTYSFLAPAQQQGGAAPERYSCFTVALPLSGLASGCQALDLDLTLSLVVQPVAVEVGGEEGRDEHLGLATAAVSCSRTGAAQRAEGRLVMRAAQRAQVDDSQLAPVADAPPPSQSQLLQEAQHQLFSNGVAASMTYTATLDPRSQDSAEWLQSLSAQFPTLAATSTHYSISFLVGTIRKDLRATLPAATSTDSKPLVAAGIDLDTCGRTSIGLVTTAVLAVLADKGITDKYVSDVVCLKAPYSEVAPDQLPPCAQDTSILLNVSLSIPIGSSAGVGSFASLSSTGTSSGSSASDVATPQELADTLVRSQLAAPWTCLSTEGQMRMASTIQLSVQLPKGPGVEGADGVFGTAPPPASTPLTGSPAPPVGRAVIQPGVDSSNAGAAGGSSDSPATATPSQSKGGIRTTEIVAVGVAVTLAVVAALLAFFAIRNLRRAKAAAQTAAESAAVAAAAATNNVAAAAALRATNRSSAGAAPPAGKLGSLGCGALGGGLGAEESYLSVNSEYDESYPTSARSPRPAVRHDASPRERQLGAPFSGGGAPQGALPWAGIPSAQHGVSPLLQPGAAPWPANLPQADATAAAAVAAAAAAAASISNEGSPRAGSNASSSTYDSDSTGRTDGALATMASDEEAGGEGRGGRSSARAEEEEPELHSLRTPRDRAAPVVKGGRHGEAQAAEQRQGPEQGGRSPRLQQQQQPASLPEDELPLPMPTPELAGSREGRGGMPHGPAGPAPRRPGRTLRVAGGGEPGVSLSSDLVGQVPRAPSAFRSSTEAFLGSGGGTGANGTAGSGSGGGGGGRAGEGYVSRAGSALLSAARGLGSRMGVAGAGGADRAAAEAPTLWTNMLFSPRLYSRTSAADGAEGSVRRATREDEASGEVSPGREGARGDVRAAEATAV